MTATATATLNPTRGDLVWSEVHGCLVRFHGWTFDRYAEVVDRNTMKLLPDLVHRTQLRRTRPQD